MFVVDREVGVGLGTGNREAPDDPGSASALKFGGTIRLGHLPVVADLMLGRFARSMR